MDRKKCAFIKTGLWLFILTQSALLFFFPLYLRNDVLTSSFPTFYTSAQILFWVILQSYSMGSVTPVVSYLFPCVIHLSILSQLFSSSSCPTHPHVRLTLLPKYLSSSFISASFNTQPLASVHCACKYVFFSFVFLLKLFLQQSCMVSLLLSFV